MHLFKISCYPCSISVQSNSTNIILLSPFSCFSFLALVIFSNVGLWTVPLRLYWPLLSPYIFFFREIYLLCFECSKLTMCQPFLIPGIEYILSWSPSFYYFSISFLRNSCLIPLSVEMISKSHLFSLEAKSLSKRLSVFVCIPTLSWFGTLSSYQGHPINIYPHNISNSFFTNNLLFIREAFFPT